MPFEKGRAKTGGRAKGTPNKLTRDVQEFVDEIFSRVDPFDKIEELLAAESEQVRAGVIDRLMQYRFGRPKETIEHTGADGEPIHHTITFTNERS